MRKRRLAALLAGPAYASLTTIVLCQGTFQNLDFENGTFIPVGGDPNIVEAGPAMPGWTPYIGTNQLSTVLYNTLSLSGAAVSIQGPQSIPVGLFHGQYVLVLQNSFPVPGELPSISQTAMIPVTARTIRFLSSQSYGGIAASFAGQGISLSVLQDLGNSQYLWGGNISPFAGQSGTLRFLGEGYLDYIQFSDQVIPEPHTLGLFAAGTLLLGWFRRIRRR